MRKKKEKDSVSRREFLKISGITVSVPMVVGPTVVKVAGEDVALHGPGPTPISLLVNGKRLTAQLEPRVTLLDALREQFEVTGPKRVCDRANCGACTVLLDGRPVYSCTTLAIEAQGRQITTAEGLGSPEQMHPVQASFVENDAQQCGFCTPGFVTATAAFVQKHPNATLEQVRTGLAGNFCRCGTYAGIHNVATHGKAPHRATAMENKEGVAPPAQQKIAGLRSSKAKKGGA
jgi:xanthine dehydrogenase YagT iron-sulfur-binding subunit